MTKCDTERDWRNTGGFDGRRSGFDRLGQIKRLKKTGRADSLIGYITLAHRATLVTRNDDHFRQIPVLKIENWVD